METPMKILVKNTSLFDPVLKETLLGAGKDQLDTLERETVYRFRMAFDEMQIYDNLRVEHFRIPEEALPRYLRGQLLSGKEKVYELLSYQLNQAIEYLEENDVLLKYCEMTGVMDLPPDTLELTLTPVEEPVSSLEPASRQGQPQAVKRTGKRKKKEKQIKVISIMPSITSFMANLTALGEQRKQKLIRAVGSAQRYKKYESLLGFSRLEENYRTFQTEYGSIDSFKTLEMEKLRKKFLEQLEKECERVKTDSKDNGSSEEAAEQTPETNVKKENQFLIAEMQIYKLTKAGRRGRVCVGIIDLMSDGRVLRFVRRPSGKAKILQETFDSYAIWEESKRTNNELFHSISQMAAQVDASLQEVGYTMETEVIDRLLKFMDLKGMLRNMRKQSIL